MAREDLDEDRIGEDPLERGIEPPERPSAALNPGDGTVAERLAEEEPDLPSASPTADADPIARPFEGHTDQPTPPRVESGPPDLQADVGAGSVADALREPGPAD